LQQEGHPACENLGPTSSRIFLGRPV